VHNWFASFWNTVERERQREISKAVHRILYESGYSYQISFYGTLKEPYDGRHYQVRIEILSTTPFDAEEILLYRKRFRGYRPNREYTLIIKTDEGLKEAITTDYNSEAGMT
jgi:hypothetical protein